LIFCCAHSLSIPAFLITALPGSSSDHGRPLRTDRLSREIDLMAEHGLRFDETTARAIGKAEARYSRSGRVALWVIALTLVYIAWKIL